MSEILVVRACAIGDFVLNLPALQALHQSRPGARFTLVGYPSVLELARDFVPVRAVRSIEVPPWSRLFSGPISTAEFDSAIVWMKEPAVTDNLRLSGIPDVRRADPFPAEGHAAAHLLRTLDLPEPPLPDLWRPASKEVIIHPGSGSVKKNWPYFEQLASRLPDAVIVLGPDSPRPGRGLRVLENLPLSEVSRLLRCSRAYIGNDSGITHLAAYLGCPTVALFGPTDPRVWGPIGRRVRLIWKAKLEEISVDEVLEALP